MPHDNPGDPAFPALHGRPAAGWVNDPNGLARVDSRYHVFFQHHPDSPRHRQIAWGHASSDDLVTWRTEPVAFGPRPGELDQRGCWTGCLTVDDGVPTAVYSGVVDESGGSHVLLARSHDGLRTWEQDSRPAAGHPSDPSLSDVRDPFLFELEGRRYAVQGAGSPTGGPSLLVYDAADLTSWTELGELLTGADPVAAEVAPANIWECPNLVRLDDTWLLVLSLWQRVADGDELAGVRWLVGDLALDDGVPRFTPSHGGLLDIGPAFYAPQLLATGGRVLLWAWSWELRDDSAVDEAGWAGVLTFPRELSLRDGRLVSAPVPELAGLRREPMAVDVPIAASAFEVELPPGPGSLRLVHGDAEQLVVSWETPARPVVRPRLLVDGSVVELFCGTPESLTTRAYPTATSRWALDLPGSATAWRLGEPGTR